MKKKGRVHYKVTCKDPFALFSNAQILIFGVTEINYYKMYLLLNFQDFNLQNYGWRIECATQ